MRSIRPQTLPTTTQALLKWGSALIELAHFQQGQRSLDQLDEVCGAREETQSVVALPLIMYKWDVFANLYAATHRL